MSAPAELAWCRGHCDVIDGDLALVGHRGCGCGSERVRELTGRRAVAEGFAQRARALTDNAARWALMHLIDDISFAAIEAERIEAALAVVEPGGAWEGGLD